MEVLWFDWICVAFLSGPIGYWGWYSIYVSQDSDVRVGVRFGERFQILGTWWTCFFVHYFVTLMSHGIHCFLNSWGKLVEIWKNEVHTFYVHLKQGSRAAKSLESEIIGLSPRQFIHIFKICLYAQLSNIWWIPNSVRIGFGPAMKTGSTIGYPVEI